MKFLTPRGLTTRNRMFPLLASVVVLGPTVMVSPVNSASAASGTSTHSNTTTADQVALALGINTRTSRAPTANRRPASDVYHVPKSFVEKKKAQCRRTFKHRNKRITCEKAKGALAVSTKYLVTKFRSRYFGNLAHKNARLAKKCRHHQHRCPHNPRYRHLTVRTCGPLAGPRAHFIATCLSRRAADYHNRWFNLSFFRTHAVPQTAIANLRLANALIGPKAKPNVSTSHHWFSLNGPYEAFTLNRAATLSAHNQVNLADGALVLANGLCVALGFATKMKPVALGCAAYVTASINGVQNDINQAFDDRKCVQFKLYFLYALPGPIGGAVAIRQGLDPTSVVSCPSGRSIQKEVQR